MPHQCVKCGSFYDDGSSILMEGCKCGCRMFFYVRGTKKEAIQKTEEFVNLTKEDKVKIEKDVYDLLGDEIDRDKPIILDLESIRIIKPGKYRIDIVKLFQKKEPIVYRLEDGKYIIDLVDTFKKLS